MTIIIQNNYQTTGGQLYIWSPQGSFFCYFSINAGNMTITRQFELFTHIKLSEKHIWHKV